jgi:hypothetical protein
MDIASQREQCFYWKRHMQCPNGDFMSAVSDTATAGTRAQSPCGLHSAFMSAVDDTATAGTRPQSQSWPGPQVCVTQWRGSCIRRSDSRSRSRDRSRRERAAASHNQSHSRGRMRREGQAERHSRVTATTVAVSQPESPYRAPGMGSARHG